MSRCRDGLDTASLSSVINGHRRQSLEALASIIGRGQFTKAEPESDYKIGTVVNAPAFINHGRNRPHAHGR